MAKLQSDNYLLNYSDELNVGSQEEKVQDLSLEEVVVDSTGGITGVILDESGSPLPNTTVKIFDTNFNPIKHTVTNSNGVYNITNIKQGDYLVYAVKDGYELSLKHPVKITNAVENIKDIQIASYKTSELGIVYGIVYDNLGNKLSGVKVNLYRKSDNTLVFSTISADDGEYVIYGINEDIYELQASNEDYVLQVPYTIDIVGEVPLNQDAYLVKINDMKEGTINGVITDKVTKAKLANCFVGLYEIVEDREVLVAGTLTDFEGRYFFGYVKEGKYIVKAKSSSLKVIE